MAMHTCGRGGDTLIRGGEIADGSGAALRKRDLLVSAGHVAAVEAPGTFDSAGYDTLDAAGLVVAPGFIDVHSHADNAPLLEQDDTSKILQGVTTEVVGNCGFGLAPAEPAHMEALRSFTGRIFPAITWGWRGGWRGFADFLATTDDQGYVTNYAPLVGHGTVRLAALGMTDRDPTGDEVMTMRRMVAEALEAGAFGMSSGLIYPPGLFSTTEELVHLAKELPADRPYATHMRGEGHRLLSSIDEAIDIGARAGCRVQISHLKSSGRANWGRVTDALQRLDGARSRGSVVTQDVYPYDRASTMLTACLPPWFQEGGDDALLARLDDPEAVARARRDVEQENGVGWESHIIGAGYDGILVASTGSHSFEGQTIAEVAGSLDTQPFDALVHVLRAEQLRASMVIASMHEADVETVLEHPHTMIGTDGLPPGVGGKPHPRLYGTFPRVLGRYVRERRRLDLPTAINRMTALPADTFSIPDRGRIVPGAVADLVGFDPERVGDACDYRHPVHTPSGIAWVLQAGHTVVSHGQWQGKRRGQRLLPDS